MSTSIINGKNISHLLIGSREASSGDAVWVPSAEDSLTDDNLLFIEEIQQSAVGKRFMARFAFGPNFDLIEATVYRLHPDAPFVTTGRLLDAMKTLMLAASDKLIPREVAPAVAPPATPAPAVDKNGRALRDSQIQWGEFSRWSENASTSERKERQRVDPVYRKWVEKQWGLRLNENPVDGDMTPNNPHLHPQEPPSSRELAGIAAKASLLVPALKQFAAEYRATPSAKVRSLRSAASNPLGYEQYEKSFQAAINAGLI